MFCKFTITSGCGGAKSKVSLIKPGKIRVQRLCQLSLFGNVFKVRSVHFMLQTNTKFITYCGFCSNRTLLYFPLFVRPSVTGVTSPISHIYKGINAMLIIRGPIKPYTFWIKIILAIFLAKTRPDQTIFSALTNLTIDFDFELSKIYKCWIRSVYFVLFLFVFSQICKFGRKS